MGDSGREEPGGREDAIPISPYSINIVQYISPPSQLARPVPPNLL